jgi:hypothetical protein
MSDEDIEGDTPRSQLVGALNAVLDRVGLLSKLLCRIRVFFVKVKQTCFGWMDTVIRVDRWWEKNKKGRSKKG